MSEATLIVIDPEKSKSRSHSKRAILSLEGVKSERWRARSIYLSLVHADTSHTNYGDT